MIRPITISSPVNNKADSRVQTRSNSLHNTFSKKTLLFGIYYVLILAVVGWKVTDTLMTSAAVVGHRTELRELTQSRNELKEMKAEYQATIATSQSLSYFDSIKLSEFEPINEVLSISINHYLAQR